ncbi:MAG: thioesterase family protein [Alphaproteobacteria bacterium]
MKPVAVGTAHTRSFATVPEQSAAATGNTGIDVVSSVTLIGFIEYACYEIIAPSFEAGEASVGVGFNLTHVAPAPIGAPITVTARLIRIEGRKYDFETEARAGERLLMTGTHQRAIVDLARFGPEERARKSAR